MPVFKKLNNGWNAEPNAPHPIVRVHEPNVALSFFLNAFIYDDVQEGAVGHLRFTGCERYRLGPTNDEGWFRGQCRYTGIAPAWGEFYEISGNDPLRERPRDWVALSCPVATPRHFLFYLRDETFECLAIDWQFEIARGPFTSPGESIPP